MQIPLSDPRFEQAGLKLETRGRTTHITKDGTVLYARVLTVGENLIFTPDASTNQKIVMALLNNVSAL